MRLFSLSPSPLRSNAGIQHLAFPLTNFPGGSKKAKERKLQPGFSSRPSVFLGRLRRPVPGGGSSPGFACSRRPPPGASAPGSGENRRLVIAGARRRLGPRVLRCPRARPGAPPPAAPGARRRRARFQPRPRQAPRRLLPTQAHGGHCGEPEPSVRELSALRLPAPPSAEEAPADGAARVPERRRRAAGGCRGATAAPLTPRSPPPPSEGAGKSPGRTRATSVGAAELRGICGPRPAPPRGAPPHSSPQSSDTAPAPQPLPPPSPGGARTRSPLAQSCRRRREGAAFGAV
ncbi:basic proline-rich protein-like [Phyllostomus hastatus]|uniref:basic proline-rich protein-like n=1 Tax=Phyllostomus hastatus TaxID=9423 RepID=UPI001E6822AB|nr:basic proline-rich protein-like [Phyllostomus hastatus]